MLRAAVIATAAHLLLAAPAIAATETDLVAAVPPGAIIVDARPLERCAAASLPGARCLPAQDILGPAKRLASFRDILWFLGTGGLSGDEHVVVVGDGAYDRDFLAGILVLAGQRRVSVLTTPAARLASQPGTARSSTRIAVFQAPMRDALIVTQSELAAMKSPALLDGREDGEYWGATVRTARGGHIAGADNLPASDVRAALAAGRGLPVPAAPIAYAHDAAEGIAYFALLRAAGVDARVYVDGWAAWAADARLPVDAATFPERPPATTAASGGDRWPLTLGIALAAFLSGGLVVLLALRGRSRWT